MSCRSLLYSKSEVFLVSYTCDFVFPRSSTVEQEAVNFKVRGSNPREGAKLQNYYSIFF